MLTSDIIIDPCEFFCLSSADSEGDTEEFSCICRHGSCSSSKLYGNVYSVVRAL